MYCAGDLCITNSERTKAMKELDIKIQPSCRAPAEESHRRD